MGGGEGWGVRGGAKLPTAEQESPGGSLQRQPSLFPGPEEEALFGAEGHVYLKNSLGFSLTLKC